MTAILWIINILLKINQKDGNIDYSDENPDKK